MKPKQSLRLNKALRKAEDDGLKKQIQSSFEGLMTSIKEAKKKKITEKRRNYCSFKSRNIKAIFLQ